MEIGYKILERNYRIRGGEIDIIARDGEYICFVEVKLRKNNNYGTPGEFITYKKREKLIKTATLYAQRKHLENAPMRFDAVLINAENLNNKLKVHYSEVIKMINFLTETTGGAFGGFFPIIMLVVMFVAMYFLTIRPQKKAEKEANDMRNNLEIGDEITTIGGIVGKIVSIKEETCVIETSHERSKIRILKSAVSRVDVKAEDAE